MARPALFARRRSPGLGELRASFGAGLKTLRGYLPGRGFRYRVPWFVLCGEPGAGKSTLAAALAAEAAPVTARAPAGAPARWWFYRQAVMIELSGDRLDAAGLRLWRAFLRLLRWYRPERPLDGMVLALPAPDLLAGRPETAAAFGERLRDAQKVLGVRFPVFVVVTRCDAVPGFRSLAAALPAGLREDVLGWSSPYPMERAFDPAWTDEAFAAIGTQLWDAGLELAAHAAETEHGDGVFRFHREVRSLAPALRPFLAELFRPTVYHDAFFFRGVYLTGAEPAEPVAEAAFAKRVFTEKVFRESGLARPVGRASATRGRATLAAQGALALTALAFLALPFAAGRLRDDEPRVRGVLEEVHRQVELLSLKHDASYAGGAATDRRQGSWTGRQDFQLARLLHGMGELDRHRLASPLFPTSWLSSVDADIREAMTASFTELVLPGMHDALLAKADSLAAISRAAPRPGPGAPVLAAPDPIAEVLALVGYLRGIGRLADNVNRYNRLSSNGEGGLDDLTDLIGYLFAERMPQSFYEYDTYYRRGLLRARGTPIRDGSAPEFGARAVLRADHQIRGAYDALLTGLEDLTARLEVLSVSREPSPTEAEELRALRAEIAAVHGFLSAPDTTWLRAGAPVSPLVGRLLDSIPDSPLLDAPRYRAAVRERFAAIRGEKLRQVELVLAGREGLGADPVVAPGAATALTLSPSLRALEASVAQLDRQRFTGSGEPVSLLAAYQPGTRLMWDVRLLDEALALHAQYAAFVANDLTGLSPASRELVQRVAAGELTARLTRVLTDAMHPLPPATAASRAARERDLRARIATLEPSQLRLEQILAVLAQLGAAEPYEELATLVADQSAVMLREVDALLAASDLYLPREGSFAWWDGAPGLQLAAYGAEGPEGVEEYLAAQRRQLRALSETLAAPVLATVESEALAPFLATTGSPLDEGARQVLDRWRRIAAELERYETKAPGNGVALLEDFVRTGMSAVSPRDCSAVAAGRGGGGGDYFASVRERLRRSLWARCLQLARTQALTRYAAVQRIFEGELAGRFPFADPGAPDAAPEAVRELLRQSATLGATGRESLPDAAADFLARLERARPLFALLLGNGEEPAAGVAVEVAFRSDRARESGADQIAEWRLQLGGRAATARDSAGGRLLWRVGDPLDLSLRWASESAVRPAPTGAYAFTLAGPATAAFRSEGSWTLLDFLRQHADGRNVGSARVVVPLGALRGGRAPDPAVVFLRLRLLDPATAVEVELPDLPRAAPRPLVP